MKKFNLFNEIIICDKKELLNACSSSRSFGITHNGAVVYEPFDTPAILIYQGAITPEPVSALMPPKPKTIAELLGSTYKVVEDGERILIKAAGAWQEIIGFNAGRCDYDDTSGDGIAQFADKELEDIGWHATEFNIGYRDLVDEIEAKCDGTLFCIEQDEPYRFSGMGYIKDYDCARKTAFDYCKQRIADLIANDEHFAPDTLTDDEEEAAQFFGIAY